MFQGQRGWGISSALVLLLLVTLAPFIILQVYRGIQDIQQRGETVASVRTPFALIRSSGMSGWGSVLARGTAEPDGVLREVGLVGRIGAIPGDEIDVARPPARHAHIAVPLSVGAQDGRGDDRCARVVYRVADPWRAASSMARTRPVLASGGATSR